MAREVLGATMWRPSFLGASNLPKLSELFRLSEDDVLWDHTVFPYATATLPTDAFERAVSNALAEGNGRGLGCVFNIAAAGVERRRMCRQCSRDELKAHGFSFWHRSHNLPGVWICLAHNRLLEATEIELSSVGAKDMHLPHECAGKPLSDEGQIAASIQRMAEISINWLRRSRGPGLPRTPEHYRKLAADNDWVAPSKRIDTGRLKDGLDELFSGEFLASAKISIVHRRGAWPYLMLRTGVLTTFPPAKHAAMQTLLERPRPGGQISLAFSPVGPDPSPAEMLDNFYASAARRELKQLLRSRQVLTTDQFMRRVGCLSHYRRQRRSLPRLSEIVREFRCSAATVKRLKPGKKVFRDD